MKTLLKIIAALVALILIAAVTAPMFISAEYVKAQLQAQVKKATGRELKIDGKASISVLPNVVVTLEEVTFRNPAGFASPYFVKVKTLSVGAALKPLLSRQLRITDITIDGAVLNLEHAASGKENWDFVSGKKDGAADAREEKKSGSSPLIIDVVHIRNSAVNYRKVGAKPMNLATTHIDADVALTGEVVKLSLGNASLYGGTAKGAASMDGPALAMRMDLVGVKIEPLMVALTGASKLEGAATIGLDVTGKGKSGDAIMRALNGTGTIKINDGAVKGINIASFLRDAKRGFVMGSSSTEKTDFTEMTASVKIAQGVATNDDLSMKSPVLRLSGKGTINLGAQTINYRAVPTLVGTIQGQGGRDDAKGIAVPLLITGPWSAIAVTPDMAGLLQESLKNPEALKQNLKSAKELIGDVNSPKDIGKALFGGGN